MNKIDFIKEFEGVLRNAGMDGIELTYGICNTTEISSIEYYGECRNLNFTDGRGKFYRRNFIPATIVHTGEEYCLIKYGAGKWLVNITADSNYSIIVDLMNKIKYIR